MISANFCCASYSKRRIFAIVIALAVDRADITGERFDSRRVDLSRDREALLGRRVLSRGVDSTAFGRGVTKTLAGACDSAPVRLGVADWSSDRDGASVRDAAIDGDTGGLRNLRGADSIPDSEVCCRLLLRVSIVDVGLGSAPVFDPQLDGVLTRFTVFVSSHR